MADYTNLQKRFLARRILLAMLFLIPLFFGLGLQPVHAQGTYPVYIVEYGDTLSWIAQRFDTTLDQLMTLNNIQPDDMLRPNDRLLIPSLEGMQGILTTEYVTLGSSLTSLSRRSEKNGLR